MHKFIWILRAAMHMRKLMGWWKPKDLAFCWEIGTTIYDNYEYEGRVSEIGEPDEEIAEELSRWGD